MANKLEISLAGVNVDKEARANLDSLMRKEYWWNQSIEPQMVIAPEPSNKFDSEALVCMVEDRKIGYVPKKFKASVLHFTSAVRGSDFTRWPNDIPTADFAIPCRIANWGNLTNKEGIFCVIAIDG